MKTRSFPGLSQAKQKKQRHGGMKAVREVAASRLSGKYRAEKLLKNSDNRETMPNASEQKVRSELQELFSRRVALHKELLLQRVEGRFPDHEAFERWYQSGRIPGYGDKTPALMVEEGRVARLIEVLDAVEAGVYA